MIFNISRACIFSFYTSGEEPYFPSRKEMYNLTPFLSARGKKKLIPNRMEAKDDDEGYSK